MASLLPGIVGNWRKSWCAFNLKHKPQITCWYCWACFSKTLLYPEVVQIWEYAYRYWQWCTPQTCTRSVYKFSIRLWAGINICASIFMSACRIISPFRQILTFLSFYILDIVSYKLVLSFENSSCSNCG